jgi:predicted nucleotidyltransferase
MVEGTLDIRPDHIVMIRKILQRYVPDRDVRVFGSRAKRCAKRYSDLDLVVMGNEPLPLTVSGALADAFSDSDLPYRVDIVDWATTPAPFRAIIEAEMLPLYAKR